MKPTLSFLGTALFFALLSNPTFAQTPVPISSTAGLTYTENFSDIANWTNGFASGIGASRFFWVDTNSSGAVPDGRKITVPTALFSSGTSSGVQRGTGNILLLASGTTDNTAAAAFDFFVDFTGVTPGTLSFDWGDVTNGTTGANPRTGSLRVYTSIDGSAFTELTLAAVLNIVNGASTSGSVTAVVLPKTLNTGSGARIRFYYYNGTGGTTGSRPKISIDNLTVTAAPAAEPKSQPTALAFSNVGSTSMNISFTAPSPSPDGYLIVRRTGALPTGAPADGTMDTVGQTVGDGVVCFAGSGTSFSETDLAASTTYGFAVFAFNGKGIGTNYLSANPLTGSKSTTAPLASSLSDIVAVSGSEASSISSLSNHASPLTSTTGTQVWQIKIRDGGAALNDGDTKPTIVTGLTLIQGTSNTVANWSSAVLAADLFDGTAHLASAAVGTSTLAFSGFTAAAPSKGTKTLTLRISLKAGGLHDGQIFQFTLTASNTSTQSDVTSSQMSPFASAASNGVKNVIGVVATQLVFTMSPSTFANLNTDIFVTVEARDANNNRDTEAPGNVTILLAAGEIDVTSGSGLTKSLSSGAASWNDLRFTTAALGVCFTTTNTGGYANPTAPPFETTNAVLVENFSYNAATPLTANGWSAHAASGTNAITVVSPGLTYAGYNSSGIGNAVSMTTSGEDDNFRFTERSKGSIYTSLLVNVSEAQSGGDYFFHLSTSALAVFTPRVFAKDSSGKLAFGVSKSSAAPNYTRAVYSYNTTYLLVLKYRFNIASDTDDVASLFVNPPLNAGEPSPAVSAPSGENDAASIGAVVLRQGGASTAPALKVDGIRLATSWGNVPLPVELSSFTAAAASGAVQLRWTTATEVGNYGFEVERESVNNEQSTMNNWDKIGFVGGHGTSNSPHHYSFTDASAVTGRYSYRLKQIDRDGSFKYSSVVETTIAPNTMMLEQNYPNPFNPSTMISFSLSPNPSSTGRGEGVRVVLKVYDILGREVATLVDEERMPGKYNVLFDGSKLSAGVYIYTMHAGNFTASKKLLLLK